MKTKKLKSKRFIFIAGPCVIENEKLTLDIAEKLKKITSVYPVDFIFKASFDKANRTSLKSFRGPGLKKGLRVLKKVRDRFKVKILSDVHCVSQVKPAAEVLDVIQIPAFLCRQTDLLLEAAKTGKAVNIKKGQFLAPEDMKYAVQKIESCRNRKILLTERGVCFGYHNLVVDFKSFGKLRKLGYPVIFDVTHSLQLPTAGKSGASGEREYALPLSKAAAAFGVDGIFCEVHPDPEKALSDSSTSINFKEVETILNQVFKIMGVLNA